jgi:outer membrane protein assembly factor BamB
MLLTDDLVIVGTDGPSEGFVYALERASGIVRWKYPAGRGVTSDIVRAGSNVFGVTQDDELCCLDALTGREVWKHKSGWDGESRLLMSCTPVAHGETVLFGGRDGSVSALDAADGTVRWQRSLGGRPVVSLMLSGGSIVAAGGDDALYLLRADTGDVERRLPLDRSPAGPLVVAGDRIVVFEGWDREGGGLVAVEPTLQRTIWRAPTPANGKWISARPFVRGDRVFLGTEEGGVYAVNLGTGALHHVGSLVGDIRVFGASRDYLFVGTIQGKLFACGLP